MGYLIYDVVIEFINYNKSSSLMNLLHHIIGYGSHMSVRLTDSYAGRFYSMLVFIAEGSTPWLHGSWICLLYTSPSPRDRTRSRMPSSA